MKNRKVVCTLSAAAAVLIAAAFIGGCSRNPGKKIRVLFIGNSHTYVNDIPALTAKAAGVDGYDMETVCCATTDYYLADHLKDEESLEALKSGGFDFVVLQEHTTPFPDEEEYAASVKDIMDVVPGKKTKFILYETWAPKDRPQKQETIERVNEAVADASGAVLASVGKTWWETLEADPDAGLYGEDGEHASEEGALLVSQVLWETIRRVWERGR